MSMISQFLHQLVSDLPVWLWALMQSSTLSENSANQWINPSLEVMAYLPQTTWDNRSILRLTSNKASLKIMNGTTKIITKMTIPSWNKYKIKSNFRRLQWALINPLNQPNLKNQQSQKNQRRVRKERRARRVRRVKKVKKVRSLNNHKNQKRARNLKNHRSPKNQKNRINPGPIQTIQKNQIKKAIMKHCICEANDSLKLIYINLQSVLHIPFQSLIGLLQRNLLVRHDDNFMLRSAAFVQRNCILLDP